VSRRIEDYALIGDMYTAALVAVDGSIDWLCLPRFDSGACMAALLGGPEYGRWSLAPRGRGWTAERRYRDDSLVLETVHTGPEGSVRVTDCMSVNDPWPDVARRVEGLSGRVAMRTDLAPRFDYGNVLPWLRAEGSRVHIIAGPDHLIFDADVELDIGSEERVEAEFAVDSGDTVDFRLSWRHMQQDSVDHLDVATVVDQTDRWWRDWAGRCNYEGPYRDAVIRSLLTLKALIYRPTGGMVAAPTTSLPELLGGERNWDYRYCWVRDASFTLLTLLDAGYEHEALEWREWLLRAAAGRPDQMQILYGVDGRRRLPELELDWLPGYERSHPVRTGNAAAHQFQLDVYGQLMDALHQSRVHDMPPDEDAWRLQRRLMDFLEGNWREPDNGIWEVRGPRRHFTHSKIMAWTAADRAVKAVRDFGRDGDADRWARLREAIFDEVCERGYDPDRNTFTQYYGSRSLDASLLTIPITGFLPADDRRVRGTVDAIEQELVADGLVHRYTMDEHTSDVDGLPEGENAFLPCCFWLADNYILRGEEERGRKLFERFLELRNDVGLLSEEYDTGAGRQVGNFPQALSHLLLIDTAYNLSSRPGPDEQLSQV
jgi:GH15 family glucan-1,4-alpha-glucosidase